MCYFFFSQCFITLFMCTIIISLLFYDKHIKILRFWEQWFHKNNLLQNNVNYCFSILCAVRKHYRLPIVICNYNNGLFVFWHIILSRILQAIQRNSVMTSNNMQEWRISSYISNVNWLYTLSYRSRGLYKAYTHNCKCFL